MSLDFRNINTLWSSLIAETLAKLGVNNAVICPGSRSTPLTIAFAENKVPYDSLYSRISLFKL